MFDTHIFWVLQVAERDLVAVNEQVQLKALKAFYERWLKIRRASGIIIWKCLHLHTDSGPTKKGTGKRRNLRDARGKFFLTPTPFDWQCLFLVPGLPFYTILCWLFALLGSTGPLVFIMHTLFSGVTFNIKYWIFLVFHYITFGTHQTRSKEPKLNQFEITPSLVMGLVVRPYVTLKAASSTTRFA